MNTQLPDYMIKKSLSYLESMIPSLISLNRIGAIDNSNITLKVITKFAEQKKWDDLFTRSYDGEMITCDFEFVRCNAIFLVICDGKKELGYMRLTTGHHWLSIGKEYCVSEAYIKPAYRGKGVFREALKLAIENHNVRAILLELERAALNASYYRTLGFCGIQQNKGLVYLLHADLYHQPQIEESLLIDEQVARDLYMALTTENAMVH
ncbi:MAG: GNAT family N-acetyltransferase [Methylophilaceae bacterium]|nr:GNAT family N-acetyltransferase [Methylophilaceae bacterium]